MGNTKEEIIRAIEALNETLKLLDFNDNILRLDIKTKISSLIKQL